MIAFSIIAHKFHMPMFLARSIFCVAAAVTAAVAAEDSAFTKKVRPFIADHCVDCHDADTARAGFRIDPR